MHDLLWKNDIVKQAKKWEIMITAWVNVALIHMTDAAIEADETVCSQNIKLCNNDNNFNDTNKKYVDSDFCNSLDMLAVTNF